MILSILCFSTAQGASEKNFDKVQITSETDQALLEDLGPDKYMDYIQLPRKRMKESMEKSSSYEETDKDSYHEAAPGDFTDPLPEDEWSELPVQKKDLSDDTRQIEQPEPSSVGGPVGNAAGQPSGALSGIIVYTTPGHGFQALSGGWSAQREYTHGIVEDFSNHDQFNHFVQFCFNAGATVVPIRPIGYQPIEVVLDNDDFGVTWTGDWNNSSSTVFYGSAGDIPYRWATVNSSETSVARYTPDIPEAGEYPVYTWARRGTDRIRQLYRIVHSGGVSTVRVDHQMVGLGWVWLGNYYFEAGTSGYVEISNQSSSQTGVVIADTIRFGNGMGDYNRGYGVSGYERELECADLWVRMSQGQGTPDLFSTYSDVSVRPRYSAYMNNSGYGSFYDRIYLSFHTNCCNKRGAMALGAKNDWPVHQEEFAYAVNNEVEDDMEALDEGVEFGQNWEDTSIDYLGNYIAYGEISNTNLQGEMTGTIIEMAYHDVEADAYLVQDPRVRYTMGRAAYQAIVKFLSHYGDNGVPLNLLPETPTHLRVQNIGDGSVRVAWNNPGGGGAGGDAPTGYVVYRSSNGYGFGNPVTVSGGSNTHVDISGLTEGETYYFRVAATNAGGESMPSETLGARVKTGSSSPVLVVNGYDRLDRWILPKRYIGYDIRQDVTMMRRDQSNSQNYVIQHGDAITACDEYFDSCSNECLDASLVNLYQYSMVVWIGGQQASVSPENFPAFNNSQKTAIQNYLNAGGRLFVTGSEIGWDMDRDSDQTDSDSLFVQNYLKGDYVDDDVYSGDTPVNRANGVDGSIFSGLSNITFDNGDDGTYNVKFPDVINPTSGASVCMTYSGSSESNVNAAVQYDSGTFKVIYLGFPFETVFPASSRNYIMNAAIVFLLDGSATPTFTPIPTPTPTPDPDAQYKIIDFEEYTAGDLVMFRDPHWSGSTSGLVEGSDSSQVSTDEANDILDPAVSLPGVKSYRFYWEWETAGSGHVRATTYQMSPRGNPMLDLTLGLSVYIKVKQGAVDFGYWIRETGGSGPVGADGGSEGTIEKMEDFRRISASEDWQYVYFDIPNENYTTLNGDGILNGRWGTLESLQFYAIDGNMQTQIEVFIDDLYQGPPHNPLSPSPTPTPTPTFTPTPTPTPSPTATPTPTPLPDPADIIDYILARGGSRIDMNEDGVINSADVLKLLEIKSSR